MGMIEIKMFIIGFLVGVDGILWFNGGFFVLEFILVSEILSCGNNDGVYQVCIWMRIVYM